MPAWLRMIVAALWVAACAPAAGPERAPGRDPGPCGDVVTGGASGASWLAIDGESELTVFVEGASQPVAGQMETQGAHHVFRPAFPLTPGVPYVVRGERCTAQLTLAPTAAPAPRVQAIYPRAARLPENILRFYVYFSEPMAEGGFTEHIRLENAATGEDITGVFFDNIHELWSSDRRRITLLVDPGRVKTGLAANRRLGRAFRAGTTYRLTVLSTWRSLRGRSLARAAVKQFVATPEDRRAIDPAQWRVVLPPDGQSIVVDFGEPVDHVSVHQLLGVRSPSGSPLTGAWEVLAGDRGARWTPAVALRGPAHAHQLVVHTRFEDVVGNNLRAAFDHAVGDTKLPREDGIIVRPLADGVH